VVESFLKFTFASMKKMPKSLLKKLESRKEIGTFRSLKSKCHLVDFSSNDYLGLARLESISVRAKQILLDSGHPSHGASGSRLLTGHHPLFEEVEQQIASYHQTETALIFNSGYDANLGLFAALPQRNDLVFYDELVHASIRDGLRLSMAKSYSFKHNDFKDLARKIDKLKTATSVWIVTEAVFSMDGDAPDWESLATVCNRFEVHLIIDEAHATGVFMHLPEIYKQTGLENHLTARVVTFGKALGCHGAAVLGHASLRDYLINFAGSLIYTTALPPASLANIAAAYEKLQDKFGVDKLHQNINHFNQNVMQLGLKPHFRHSVSAIHCCIVPGNEGVKMLSLQLEKSGFDVRPILSPTVAAGKERLRFCLHAFNDESDIENALKVLATHL
jgi:8-amino-7-oxononanoate synthase